jgi:hypothetical protein
VVASAAYEGGVDDHHLDRPTQRRHAEVHCDNAESLLCIRR